MGEVNKYRSIGKVISSEIREKGSKFLGLASVCLTEDEVKATLELWREEHPQATHICYAYRLGVSGEKYRANDDGEPSNSAGAPILGQLQSFDLTNVLVGVVRYYGGTKLGVGGLISAYKQAAKEVLETAEIIEFVQKRYTNLNFNYLDMPHVMAVLKRLRMEITETNMTDICQVTIQTEIEDEMDFAELLGMYPSVELVNVNIY